MWNDNFANRLGLFFFSFVQCTLVGLVADGNCCTRLLFMDERDSVCRIGRANFLRSIHPAEVAAANLAYIVLAISICQNGEL